MSGPRKTPARVGALAALALLPLGACVYNPAPEPTQVIVNPAPQAVIVPNPPPPAQPELVPPPPQGAGLVVWQPGHWAWAGLSGNPWTWIPGRYVAPPPGRTQWAPGQWVQQSQGGWSWIEGHWM